MKGVPTIASIPVNLLSEYSIEGAVAKACDMEANECPVKPFLAAEIAARLWAAHYLTPGATNLTFNIAVRLQRRVENFKEV